MKMPLIHLCTQSIGETSGAFLQKCSFMHVTLQELIIKDTALHFPEAYF